MPTFNWVRVENRGVSGLGQAELFQSVIEPSDFQAKLILNSYESNCLRDWLAQRWNAQSLEHCCVVLLNDQNLIVTLSLTAITLQEARGKFDGWLDSVLKDRESSHLSRK